MQALLLAGLVWSALGHTDEASEVVRAEGKELPFTVGREREGRGVAFFLGVLIGVLMLSARDMRIGVASRALAAPARAPRLVPIAYSGNSSRRWVPLTSPLSMDSTGKLGPRIII